MPDGNAPSSLPRPDLSGLFDDVGRSLGQLQAHAETFTRAADAIVGGFDEANEMVNVGSGFRADMLQAQEETRPFATKGREIAERAEKALTRLRQEAEGLEGRSPTEQRELVAGLRAELEAINQETATLRAAEEHFELVAHDLSRRGEKLSEMNPMVGERFQELSRIATQAALESAEGRGYASRLSDAAPELETAEAAFVAEAGDHAEADAMETESNTKPSQDPAPEPGATQAKPSEAQEVNEQRGRLRNTLARQRREATEAATATETTEAATQTANTHEELAAPLQGALEEAAKKSRYGTKKEAVSEPEKRAGELTEAAKETVAKPPIADVGIPATTPEAENAPSSDLEQDAERKRPTRDLDSAAIASAIQETMRAEAAPEPAQERTEDRNTSTTAPGRPLEPTISPTEQQKINEARAELKGKYAERKRDTEILTLYGERMSTRSWEYLQGHDQVRYGQLQAAQASVPNLQIDGSIFLSAEERQGVHLSAVVDLRASFPDVTDERLSSLLLLQSLNVLQAQQNADRSTAALAIAGVLAGTQALQASAAAQATPAVFAALANQINATRDALAKEEQHATERAQAVRMSQAMAPATGGGGTAVGSAPRQGATATLQAQQRQGLDTRRALQAALHAQVQQLAAGNALGSALAQQAALSADQAQAANGLLAFILPTNLRAAPSGERVGAQGRDLLRADASERNDRAPDSTNDAADRSAYETELAAKLATQQMQDRRFDQISQSPVGGGTAAGGSAGSSLIGNVSDPLLDSNRLRPLSPQEIFARKQAAMRERAKGLSGEGLVAGGFEAAFGDGDALPNAGAETIEVEASDLISGDATETADAQTAEEAEAARVQELLQRQQQDRAAQDQGNGPSSKLEQAKKLQELGSSPAGTQAKAQALKLLGTPLGVVAILALVVILIIWLNIRLFFSDEESTWRKPLGTWGKMGTIILDFFIVINAAFSLALLIIICILPFLPALLALGGIFATLQAAIRLFGG